MKKKKRKNKKKKNAERGGEREATVDNVATIKLKSPRALFPRGWRLMTGYYTQENDPRRITLHSRGNEVGGEKKRRKRRERGRERKRPLI